MGGFVFPFKFCESCSDIAFMEGIKELPVEPIFLADFDHGLLNGFIGVDGSPYLGG